MMCRERAARTNFCVLTEYTDLKSGPVKISELGSNQTRKRFGTNIWTREELSFKVI